MKKTKTIIRLLLLLLSINATGQVKNHSYEAFSSKHTHHTIRFLNDSVVEFQNIKKHMSGVTQVYGKFKKKHDTISIEIPRLRFSDSIKATEFEIYYLSGMELKLTKHKSELIDRKNKIVYVKSSILKKNRIRRKSIVIINGKRYKLDHGITVNGVIVSEPRKNRALIKFYPIVNHIHDYTMTIYDRLEGYEKFGILGIKGVIIINSKNKTIQ